MAAGAGQQTQPEALPGAGRGVGGSVCIISQTVVGRSICVNCSKVRARSADEQAVPDLGMSTRQAENELLTESLRRKCDGSCSFIISCIYF